MKRLIALALVAGFLAAGSIGCNKDTKTGTTKSAATATEEKSKKDK